MQQKWKKYRNVGTAAKLIAWTTQQLTIYYPIRVMLRGRVPDVLLCPGLSYLSPDSDCHWVSVPCEVASPVPLHHHSCCVFTQVISRERRLPGHLTASPTRGVASVRAHTW